MFRLLALLLLLAAPAARAAEPPRIDVAFVLDATGSMGPWISEARSRINAIAHDLAEGDPRPQVRFALVRYRDRGDSFLTQTVRFTADIDAMKKALEATSAEGGGDTPEAVLEALQVGVEELDWDDRPGVLRLLYLVGDAEPTHHKDTPPLEDVLLRALERRIVIHSIACGSMEASGQRFFEEVARLSEGRPFRLADAGPRRRAESGHVSDAGAAGADSLAAAVSGSARAYSDAVGVGFAGRPVEATPLAVPAGPSGLIGAHVRLVRDAGAWADLWAAHQSLAAGGPPPAFDFDKEQILVLGGADAGLDLDNLSAAGDVRVAFVRAASPGVRFLRIPAAETPVVARDADEGAL
ncbi:MAG: VWA domain-containing protein [Myxococcales bacterium]|nr:VWA domain-containing protein [Myxococcales bacterium]